MMQSIQLKSSFILIFPFVVILCTASLTMANTGGVTISSAEDGYTILLNRGLLGESEIKVVQDGPAKNLYFFGRMVKVTIKINKILSDPPAIDTNFSITVPMLGLDLLDLDIEMPFFDFGLEKTPAGLNFEQAGNDHDIELSLLFRNNSFQYHVNAGLFNVFEAQWAGQAKLKNCIVQQEAFFDLTTLTGNPDYPEEAQLILTLLPVFNLSRISLVGVSFDIFKDTSDPIFSWPEDLSAFDSISILPVPLPNGSFRLWADSQFETIEDFIIWLKAYLPEEVTDILKGKP
jgi:hypothetical protein